MAHCSALGAFLALAPCVACSSPATVDFDHGSAAGGAQRFGTGEARLAYPAPPYGAAVNATIEDFHFLGWKNPKDAAYDTNQLSTVQLSQFYDQSGSQNIRYLVITSTAVWCSACKLEYQDMATKVDAYQGKGVRFLGALFEDNNNKPAQPSDLATWAQNYHVTFGFVLDPELKFGNFFDREATPMEMIVDTTNMQVVDIATGWATSGPNSTWAKIDSLLGG